MNGYCYIAGIAALLLAVPYIRIFAKRISLYIRLKQICRKRGFRMVGTHFGWLFSSWRYPRHDFVVEGDHVIYSVKLMAAKRRTDVLCFDTPDTFHWRHQVAIAWLTTSIILPTDSKKYTMPAYDFDVPTGTWSTAEVKPILLVNPTCTEFNRVGIREHRTCNILFTSWERVGDMYVCTADRFLGELETYDHERFLYR